MCDKTLKCDGYQREPASMVHEFFDKKFSCHALNQNHEKPGINRRITQTN